MNRPPNGAFRRRFPRREPWLDLAPSPGFSGRTCSEISIQRKDIMKSFITAIAFAFVAAVASVQAAGTKCPECCKDKDCATCCKGNCAECANCNK
jgi:hypothetical protein